MKTLNTTKLLTISLRRGRAGGGHHRSDGGQPTLDALVRDRPTVCPEHDRQSWRLDRRRPLMGPGVLAGGALALLTISLVRAWARMLGTGRRVITTRHRKGWTKIDRDTLEDALERRLEVIDRRNDIVVRINRRSRVNARLVTPDPSVSGPAQEMRDTIDAQCESRSLPCRSGRITSTVPRFLTSRREVR